MKRVEVGAYVQFDDEPNEKQVGAAAQFLSDVLLKDYMKCRNVRDIRLLIRAYIDKVDLDPLRMHLLPPELYGKWTVGMKFCGYTDSDTQIDHLLVIGQAPEPEKMPGCGAGETGVAKGCEYCTAIEGAEPKPIPTNDDHSYLGIEGNELCFSATDEMDAACVGEGRAKIRHCLMCGRPLPDPPKTTEGQADGDAKD